MSNSILDETAIIFSTSFYKALAYGENIKKAFSLAINQIKLLGMSGSNIPQLISYRNLETVYF